MELVEIGPGLWARPDQVMAVRTTRGTSRGTLTLKPSVHVHIAGCSDVGWEFDNLDDAMAWADQIAKAVNRGLTEQRRVTPGDTHKGC